MKRAKQRLTVCPPEFQERLTRAGGVNRYGQPNFLLVWGESYTVRRGGVWEQDDGTYFRGYRDAVEDGRACWVLKQWKAPEIYGTPAMYFLENRDEATGLQILGDYPWRGRYETLQPLVWRGLVNGQMRVEHMPLNAMLLDLVIPIVIRAKDATMTQKRAAFEMLEEKKNRDEVRSIDARRHDSKLAFKGPVSYSRQGCRTSLVDQKVYQMQKHWDQALANWQGRGLGISLA